jgi:hypothetical protein
VVVLALCLSTSTGCVAGFIYHHVTVPLDTNFDATPVHPGDRGRSQKRVVIPYPVRMHFDWGSSAIGDGMREAGITRAYYADMETRSFMGVWTERWVHVYGE